MSWWGVSNVEMPLFELRAIKYSVRQRAILVTFHHVSNVSSLKT